jgi:hypothetical protein
MARPELSGCQHGPCVLRIGYQSLQIAFQISPPNPGALANMDDLQRKLPRPHQAVNSALVDAQFVSHFGNSEQ